MLETVRKQVDSANRMLRSAGEALKASCGSDFDSSDNLLGGQESTNIFENGLGD